MSQDRYLNCLRQATLYNRGVSKDIIHDAREDSMTSAVIYSLIETAKENDLDPYHDLI